MKGIIWNLIKPLLTAIGVIWSSFMAFDHYDTTKIIAHTDPIKRELKHIQEYNKTSLERLERESIMIRSNQDKTNDLIMQLIRDRK
jgi:hypothetical protein